MTFLAAAHGPSPLWYASRGAGATALALLTLSVAFGIVETRGLRTRTLPRFAIASLHRTLSLFGLTVIVVHVVTTLLDPFPRFAITTVFVPFAGNYRPVWVGLGALAFDLLVAVVVTSLVRARLGYRAWRGVHWAAYACWPVALLHGLGTGSDARTTWMLVLSTACVGIVLAAIGTRLAAPGTAADVQTGGIALALLGVLGIGIWAAQGPLAHGWASRAGTPRSVLAAFRPAAAVAAVRAPATPAPKTATKTPVQRPAPRAFSAPISGELHSGLASDGSAVVDLRMRVADSQNRRLRLRIGGDPLEDGGVRMRRSAVSFGPPSHPGEFQGRIEVLRGDLVRALVGSSDGRAMRLQIALSLQDGSVSGRVSGVPVALP